MLAALTRAPSRYSPEANLKVAQTRAAMVIDLLLEDGQINEEQAKKAKANPAKPVLKEGTESANYFADFVMDQLTKLDIRPNQDLVVSTTIDTRLQTVAQKTLTAVLDKDGKGRAVTQGALVAMEPSGAIRSIVGGRDYTRLDLQPLLSSPPPARLVVQTVRLPRGARTRPDARRHPRRRPL